MYLYINVTGSSGDVFPNLSVGSHSIDVQFTPDGSCEIFTLQPSISFIISAPPLKVNNQFKGRIVRMLNLSSCPSTRKNRYVTNYLVCPLHLYRELTYKLHSLNTCI